MATARRGSGAASPPPRARSGSVGWRRIPLEPGRGWSSAAFMGFWGLSLSRRSPRGIFQRDVDPEHPPHPCAHRVGNPSLIPGKFHFQLVWNEIIPLRAGRGGKRGLIHGGRTGMSQGELKHCWVWSWSRKEKVWRAKEHPSSSSPSFPWKNPSVSRDSASRNRKTWEMQQEKLIPVPIDLEGC